MLLCVIIILCLAHEVIADSYFSTCFDSNSNLPIHKGILCLLENSNPSAHYVTLCYYHILFVFVVFYGYP
jgi:hypothetical protein